MSIQIDKETKSKARLLEVIRQELTGWEDAAIKVDPPASYDNRTTVVKKSYDAPPKSISELIDRMKGEGASEQLIMHAVLLWAEKSYDHRTTVVRCEPYEAKKAYDRRYRKERRDRDRELKKVVRLNDSQNVVTLKEIKIDTEKKDKKVRTAIVYSKDFEDFWRAYPRTPSMGKSEAYTVWKKIGPEERQLALAAVPKFSAWVKTQKPDYVVLHACRFLSKKRFEGFVAPVEPEPDFNTPPDWWLKREAERNAAKANGHEGHLSLGGGGSLQDESGERPEGASDDQGKDA